MVLRKLGMSALIFVIPPTSNGNESLVPDLDFVWQVKRSLSPAETKAIQFDCNSFLKSVKNNAEIGPVSKSIIAKLDKTGGYRIDMSAGRFALTYSLSESKVASYFFAPDRRPVTDICERKHAATRATDFAKRIGLPLTHTLRAIEYCEPNLGKDQSKLPREPGFWRAVFRRNAGRFQFISGLDNISLDLSCDGRTLIGYSNSVRAWKFGTDAIGISSNKAQIIAENYLKVLTVSPNRPREANRFSPYNKDYPIKAYWVQENGAYRPLNANRPDGQRIVPAADYRPSVQLAYAVRLGEKWIYVAAENGKILGGKYRGNAEPFLNFP